MLLLLLHAHMHSVHKQCRHSFKPIHTHGASYSPAHTATHAQSYSHTHTHTHSHPYSYKHRPKRFYTYTKIIHHYFLFEHAKHSGDREGKSPMEAPLFRQFAFLDPAPATSQVQMAHTHTHIHEQFKSECGFPERVAVGAMMRREFAAEKMLQ